MTDTHKRARSVMGGVDYWLNRSDEALQSARESHIDDFEGWIGQRRKAFRRAALDAMLLAGTLAEGTQDLDIVEGLKELHDKLYWRA